MFEAGAGVHSREILVGLTFIKHGSISSHTEEMIDEPSPQFFHPPSTTIKRLVFFTELTIEEVKLRSIVSSIN